MHYDNNKNTMHKLVKENWEKETFEFGGVLSSKNTEG